MRTVAHQIFRAEVFVAIASLALASVVVPLSMDSSAVASSVSLCKAVTAAEVSKALSVKVSNESKQINGSVTVCWFKVGANSQAVYVRSQTGDNASGYQSDLKAARTQQEHPKTDTKFAPYKAFSTSVGSPTYGFTYSVTVLKKSTELSVGAASVTLTKVEGLAKKVLPIL